uniref:NB-ARC domain-containing protein n=1 Tax=Oryza meridionalis TaxID=40149 RepID=A0A0E0DSY2_9ORYZ
MTEIAPLNLKTVAERITEKCQGLPLSCSYREPFIIQRNGGTSSSKKKKWRNMKRELFYNQLRWQLSKQSRAELDYRIDRKRLIRLWIAEGSVQDRGPEATLADRKYHRLGSECCLRNCNIQKPIVLLALPKLGYTKLKDIPRLIGKLSNLQMLYLNGSVLELPSETITKLHHLLIDVGRFGKSASSKISRLQHLQTLRSVEANNYMVKKHWMLHRDEKSCYLESARVPQYRSIGLNQTSLNSLSVIAEDRDRYALFSGQLETSISPGEADDNWQAT